MPATRFVVQLHDATTLHFDLRIQVDEVLRSWAVPKGPSLDPAVRRLAVPVEDHDLAAGEFEGVHEGQRRGSGAVIIWDEGLAEVTRDEPGHVAFTLHGSKLTGGFALTRTGERRWILVKTRDAAARPGSDIVADRPASVRTGRTWQEVAARPRPTPLAAVPIQTNSVRYTARMSPTPQQRRAARHLQPGAAASTLAARRGPSGGAKKPITVEAIISTAFGIVEKEGYQALTMRRVATALETGPSSLYAHVVNKEDLDELLIGRLCAEIDLPEPDPVSWRQQIASVCAHLRDQYLRFPGISQAAFAVAPSNLDTLRVSEGMLAILLAGGVDPRTAAWAIDSLTLYVNAYSLELSLVNQRLNHTDGSWVVSRDELLRRYAALPGTFPQSKRYAAELTAGTGHDRFDFTIGLMIDGLARR